MAVRRTGWCLVAQALHCISGVTYLTWGLSWWWWSLMRVSTIGQDAACSEWYLNIESYSVFSWNVMTTIWCLQEPWSPFTICASVIFVHFRQIQSFLQEFPKVNWSELRVCTGAGSDLQKQVDLDYAALHFSREWVECVGPNIKILFPGQMDLFDVCLRILPFLGQNRINHNCLIV